MFENYSNCRILISQFWHFSPIFASFKVTYLVTLFDKLQVFKSRQNENFLHLKLTFVHLKCECSSLRSQY